MAFWCAPSQTSTFFDVAPCIGVAFIYGYCMSMHKKQDASHCWQINVMRITQNWSDLYRQFCLNFCLSVCIHSRHSHTDHFLNANSLYTHKQLWPWYIDIHPLISALIRLLTFLRTWLATKDWIAKHSEMPIKCLSLQKFGVAFFVLQGSVVCLETEGGSSCKELKVHRRYSNKVRGGWRKERGRESGRECRKETRKVSNR